MTEKKFNWTKAVRSAAKGDQGAWEALYRATYRSAYFVAIKVIGSEEDAADLVQDAYITAMENLDNLKEPEKFQSWLNMIVANKCRDQLRRKKPALFSEMFAEDGEEPEWMDDREDIRPEVALDQAETVRLVAEIIDGLPEDQKLCVTLFYRDELSVGQIAKALEISEGTVKSRLNYARKKIKAKVEALEKQGVKLYGIAPIPFFIWLLKNSAEDVTIPANAASLPAAGKASAGSRAVSGSQTGAAAGAKAGATAVAAKVAACITAASVALGGAYGYAKGHNRKEAARTETSSYTETFSQMEASTEEPEGNAAQERANEEAMEAYYALLRHGYTSFDMPIKYYAFLDIDQNGVNELVAADNAGTPETWTSCEVYSYKDGSFIFLGETNAHYDYFYYVNGQYLLGHHRMGDQYISYGENIATTIYHWNEDGTRNDPAIMRNNGDWEYISQEEFDYYNCRNRDCDGTDCFVKSSEIITLLENAFAERNMLEETLDFSKAWAFMLPSADGTYADPFENPDVPYFGIAMISFGFTEKGDVEVLYYETYSDVFLGDIGTYSVSDKIVEFSFGDGNEDRRYAYEFDAEKLTFTQLSNHGIGDTAETVHQLIEDPFHDRNSLFDSVDVYFYLQEHPDAYDG